MNTLSWFIYIAATIPTLVQTIGLILVVGIIVSVIALGIRGMSHDSNRGDYDRRFNPEKYEAAVDFFKNKRYMVHIRHIVWAVVGLVMLSAVPTEKVFYMIAASEMGEMVVTSEPAAEVMNELKDTIMFQLDKLQGETQ